MAWTTPPTFADGNYLTAANLNILSDDIEYLYGRALQTNPGFVIQYVNDSDYSNDTVSGWAIKHVSNTLRYRLVITGSVDYVYIRYNSVTVVTKTAAGTFNETVDVTSLGLTVGDIYPLSVTIRADSGQSAGCEVQYLGEEW